MCQYQAKAISPYALAFGKPTLKIRFFSEPHIILTFFTLNPSHLLKVTEFWDKISQFKFLVMTEKNIFRDKVFCHEIFQILLYFV